MPGVALQSPRLPSLQLAWQWRPEGAAGSQARREERGERSPEVLVIQVVWVVAIREGCDVDFLMGTGAGRESIGSQPAGFVSVEQSDEVPMFPEKGRLGLAEVNAEKCDSGHGELVKSHDSPRALYDRERLCCRDPLVSEQHVGFRKRRWKYPLAALAGCDRVHPAPCIAQRDAIRRMQPDGHATR